MSKKLTAAISDLADLFEYGHLQAETDPAELLNGATREIKALRVAVIKHRWHAASYSQRKAWLRKGHVTPPHLGLLEVSPIDPDDLEPLLNLQAPSTPHPSPAEKETR